MQDPTLNAFVHAKGHSHLAADSGLVSPVTACSVSVTVLSGWGPATPGSFSTRRLHYFTDRAFSSSLYMFWISAVSRILEGLGNNNENGVTLWIFLKKIQPSTLPAPRRGHATCVGQRPDAPALGHVFQINAPLPREGGDTPLLGMFLETSTGRVFAGKLSPGQLVVMQQKS